MTNKEKGGSIGLLSGIEETGKKIKKDKSKNSQEFGNLGSEELTVKRSYTLKASTIKMLQELKVFIYEPGTQYNDIVDEAIRALYEIKKNTNS